MFLKICFQKISSFLVFQKNKVCRCFQKHFTTNICDLGGHEVSYEISYMFPSPKTYNYDSPIITINILLSMKYNIAI